MALVWCPPDESGRPVLVADPAGAVFLVIETYVDEDAQFWVVRPEITTQRITGLETVLSLRAALPQVPAIGAG